MYEKYPKICISAFILCVICFLFSPKESSNVSIQEVSAKEATTKTGRVESGVLQKVQSWAKEDRKEETVQKVDKWSSNTRIDCDKDCKIKTLIDLGIRKEIAESLIINCKALAENPVLCIKIGASIVKNESGWGNKCRKYNQYNCMGLSVKDNYKSYNDGVLHWVWKYTKHWYKAKNMSYFYSPAWELPISWYCKSEESSNTAVGCPRWLKISQDFFNSIPF